MDLINWLNLNSVKRGSLNYYLTILYLHQNIPAALFVKHVPSLISCAYHLIKGILGLELAYL